MRLTKNVVYRLKNFKAKHARIGRNKLSSWTKLKKKLKEKLLPSDFRTKAIFGIDYFESRHDECA